VVFINDNLPKDCKLDTMPQEVQPHISEYHDKRGRLNSSIFQRKKKLRDPDPLGKSIKNLCGSAQHVLSMGSYDLVINP